MSSKVLWAATAGLGATMLIAGCTATSDGVGTTSHTTASGGHSAAPAPAPSTARPTAAALGTILQTIAVHTKDLSKGYSTRLIPGGNQVVDQVTLDNCGYDFTTESDRIARREYEIVAGSADTGLGNEVVAYDTATHAALALDQWHTAAATCPHGPVRSTVAGVPKVRTTIRQNSRDVVGLPASDNTVTEESLASAHQGTVYALAILQVNGRYLDALYLSKTSPITSAERAAAATLAVVTGRRLVTQH